MPTIDEILEEKRLRDFNTEVVDTMLRTFKYGDTKEAVEHNIKVRDAMVWLVMVHAETWCKQG